MRVKAIFFAAMATTAAMILLNGCHFRAEVFKEKIGHCLSHDCADAVKGGLRAAAGSIGNGDPWGTVVEKTIEASLGCPKCAFAALLEALDDENDNLPHETAVAIAETVAGIKPGCDGGACK